MADIIYGKLVDVEGRKIVPSKIIMSDGKISKITPVTEDILQEYGATFYILPGFVDSHCHIESSMLTPAEFGRNALHFGTLAAVCDPHEIANVCGEPGIYFMINSARKTPMKIFFSLPSCVPSVDFEINGTAITAEDTAELITRKEFVALSEMMNFPGVISADREVMAKIEATVSVDKPIDGHAPGLTGDALKIYAGAGISTDHESTSIAEAEEKIAAGMSIQIREGSSAKSLDELMSLIDKYPDRVMFCADDIKAIDLKRRHIKWIVGRAVASGCDLFNVLRAASLNPIKHYNIPVGFLREGDPADFIVVDNLEDFNVSDVYLNGVRIDDAECKESGTVINNFSASTITVADIPSGNVNDIIGLMPDSLYTYHLSGADVNDDILKIVCLDRYNNNAKPVAALVHGFGLKKGAFGSTVAHDSHNITVVGCDDNSIVAVINAIVQMKGGMVVFDGNKIMRLPLNIAGLMSTKCIDEVSESYVEIEQMVKRLGCGLPAPFMTLSFMSLPVIPSLKITAGGLFDVDKFSFIG